MLIDMETNMKKQFYEEQIVSILGEGETDGMVVRDVCRKHSITELASPDSTTCLRSNLYARHSFQALLRFNQCRKPTPGIPVQTQTDDEPEDSLSNWLQKSIAGLHANPSVTRLAEIKPRWTSSRGFSLLGEAVQ